MFNSFNYNVDIAKVFGVRSSVLIQYILFMRNVCEGDEVVSLTREQIFRGTGLLEDEQIDVENSLVSQHLLSVEKVSRSSLGKSRYCIDEGALQQALNRSQSFSPEVLMSPCESVSGTVEKKATRVRMSKKEAEIKSLKSSIKEESEIVRQYLYDWIDAVMLSPRGYLSKQGVKISVEDLNRFSESEDVKVEVLRIAVKNSYRDLKWAISAYQKDNPTNTATPYRTVYSTGLNMENGAF